MTILSLQYFIHIFVRFCDSKPLQLNMLREITKSYLLKLYTYNFFMFSALFCSFFIISSFFGSVKVIIFKLVALTLI